MQGRNSQPIPTFLDKKARPNEGFALRKSQGSAMPAAPKTAVRAMYLTAREKICSHVSVWDCGSRQTRVGTRFAVTKPVMTSKAMSEVPSGTDSRTCSASGGPAFLMAAMGSAFHPEVVGGRFITRPLDDSILHSYAGNGYLRMLFSPRGLRWRSHCLVLPILDEGRSAMVEEVRFLWNATRGNRFRPWRSPYLRWRLETFTGQRAETVQARDFWNLFWNEKRQFFRFLRWTREMKGYADSEKNG